MAKFIGRQHEIKKLLSLSNKKTASFIVIKGRRRIGKSRLIDEISAHFDHYYRFEGLAPKEGVTPQDQRDAFSKQMTQQFKLPFAHYTDWSDLFWTVGERITKGKILFVLDEISWMGMDDPTFLGKVKYFWDNFLKKNDHLFFIICGSASAWIERNILTSTGFAGRISYTLTLEELPLSDCDQFWPKNISAYEKLKILSVTGGIPKYLEEINANISAEENVKQLCFTQGAILVKEFEQIFSYLFLRKSPIYKKILEALVVGPQERNSICRMLHVDPNGRISEYLEELQLAGFITRDYTLDIKSGNDSKLSEYRLSDNYIRFYLKYIEKNLSKIERNSFRFKSLASLPEWNTMIALQFENIVLNNRALIHEALHITPDDIISENPFYQHKTRAHAGCQIDYMIQTKFNTLYICEIKFSKHPIGASIIPEVQQKIDALHLPRSFSCRPVLIYVNGVTEELVEQDYFALLMDFSSYLHHTH